MKYYAVAEITMTNPQWVAAYAENVTRMVEKVGGRYLARTGDITHMEGEGAVPNIFLVLEFPSKDVADAFYESEEYKPYLQSRREGSIGDFYLVAGKDDTGQTVM